jgi:uncharacterized protein (UPF0303 family)
MDDAELESLIAEVEAQEAELRFPAFSNEDALALGMSIVEIARARALSLTVDIRRSGQQLFHCALPGTSADNDQWLLRKARVVERFGRSSFLVGLRLRRDGARIEDRHFVDPREFSAHGGCFPVHVRGTGIVGTVAVSGLPQEEDHALVVEAIRDFLGKRRS